MTEKITCPLPGCGSVQTHHIRDGRHICHDCGTEWPQSRRAEPAPSNTEGKSKYVMDQPWLDKMKEAGRAKMEFINSHQEELVTAFVAKTGFQPDECTLCIEADDEGLTRYWVERKTKPKEVPELPPEFNKHNFDCPYGSLVYISGFGAYVKANYGIMMELKYVDWLAACDKAGCTAESVVAKMREAGR